MRTCDIEDCEARHNAQGLCKVHYTRALKSGEIMPLQRRTPEQRFWSKVEKAHRVAWEMTNGPIPEGLFCCHRCDTPACVNPAHIFLGTHADNMRDMVAKGRQGLPSERSDKCSRGHDYTPENTAYYNHNGYRCRRCRTCSNAINRAFRAKHSESKTGPKHTTATWLVQP